MAWNAAGSSVGSTTATSRMPTARATSSMTTWPAGPWSSVRPVPGCSCMPVMAVVPLSRIEHHVAGGRRVVHHLHQPGDAAVHEGAVADDADHAAGLLRRQHVPQAQAHADARAHADAGVHGLERRQHAQRVAADVAGHDAVEVAQHRRTPSRCGQPGHSSGGLPGRRCGLRATCRRARIAPHARHVQLAEAVHLRLALDRDAGRAQRRRPGTGRLPRSRRSAPPSAANWRMRLERQRIGHAQLEDGGASRRGLARVHVARCRR